MESSKLSLKQKLANFFAKIQNSGFITKTKNFFVKINDLFFHYFKKYDIYILLVVLFILSLIVRIYCFDLVSHDYTNFLEHWFDYFQTNGGFKVLGNPLGDYTAFYRTFLCIISYIPVNSLYQIKIFSIIFDYSLAIAIFFIVKNVSKNNYYAVLAFGLASFLPEVILNSSIWGQCDSIYTSFIAWSLYFTIKGKKRSPFILFAIAFSIKLQSIFYLPFLLVLWLKQKTKLRYFLYIPLVYFIVSLPVLFAGGDLINELKVYFIQASEYKQLSLSAPSIFSFINNSYSNNLLNFAAVFGLGIIGTYSFYFYKSNLGKNSEELIFLAYFISLICPFFLPSMHERYFYLSSALSILVVFLLPKRFKVSALITTTSVMFCLVNYYFSSPLFFDSANMTRICAFVNLCTIFYMTFNFNYLDSYYKGQIINS